ncbi:MAG: MATE family efflux transporter [Oscillospiraceae bacterium]|nr:MATE family efflux transporter [Oscillospiraceae bacterium]
MKETTIDNPLGTHNIGVLMLRFAVPTIVSNLVNASYNLVDQIIIGNSVGMLGIAATNVAFPLTTISAATAYLLGPGGGSRFSISLGRGDKEAANRYACNTLSILVILGTIIAIGVLLFAKKLVMAFGSTDTVQPLALTYTRIIAIGIPFGIFTTGASSIIRADGSPRYSMWCTLVGALFNIVGDPLAVFVFGWGIAGVAWATTISQILTAALSINYFLRKSRDIAVKKAYLRPDFRLARDIMALGLTPCINQLGATILQITLNNTLRHYGALSIYGSDIPLSCVGAISKLGVIFTSITVGIAQGGQPILGFNYGAGMYGRVKKTLRDAVIAATSVSVLAFLVFQIFPRPLMLLFGEDDPLYLEFGVHYLRTFMFMIFLSGVQPVAATFFPAIGKATRGLWISLSRQVIFIIPLLLILPRFFGLDGAVYSGPASDFGAALISASLIFAEVRKMPQGRRIINDNGG